MEIGAGGAEGLETVHVNEEQEILKDVGGEVEELGGKPQHERRLRDDGVSDGILGLVLAADLAPLDGWRLGVQELGEVL